MRAYGITAIFPFAKKGYPRPNVIGTIETNHGQMLGKPHPFPDHSPAGGEDTSGTAVQRLQLDKQGFYHYAERTQPPPPMARYAFLAHRVSAVAVTGWGPGVANPPNPYQSGMMYMPEMAAPVTGLGGLAGAQIQYQNLIQQEDYQAGVDEFQP